MNNIKTYAIVNPSAINTMVLMLLIIAFQIFKLNYQPGDRDILYYCAVVLAVLAFVVLIVIIVRTYILKPTKMRMDNESIHIRGRVIRADDIKLIMISLNKKQVIGIKPKGKLIVPLHLCFRYLDDQDDGIGELESWAQQKQIMIKKGSFSRWL